MARENYEVYYHQNGRWQLHGSFGSGERDQAVAEGTSIEAKQGFPARVLRSTIIDDAGTTEEVVTWQSPKAKKLGDADAMFGPRPPAPKKKSAPDPEPERQERPKPTRPKPPRPAAKSPPRKPKAKAKKRTGLTRFIISILISLGLAIVSLIASSLIVAQFMSMGVLRPANYTQLIIGSSVIVFFLAMFVNLQRQFDIIALLRAGGRSKPAPSTGADAMIAAVKTKKKRPAVQDIEFDDVEIEDLRAKIAAEDAAADAAEAAAEAGQDAPPPDLGADMDAEMGSSVHSSETPAPAPPTAPPTAAPQQPQPSPAAAPKAATKAPMPQPRAPDKSPAELEARGGLSQFISSSLSAAKPEPTNAFAKFGMNLYFAGGASVIGQSKRLAKDAQLSVLKDSLIAAGNTPERAENFCVELPTYGKNPRYTGMVQAGAKAMTSMLKGETSATANVGALLAEWNLPEKRPTVPSVFTFVFTDIVGSTAMTQKLGNAGAQKAVRAHNTAVRGAIQIHKGREVKHTGDGIMAVFPDPVLAVKATIRMLRDVAAHNAASPQTEVMVRIGINVGEAVEEENDFFGAAVQMTARICDKANKGNVWVSQAVKDACKGQKIGFIPRGGFEMKGIQGKKPLYEVGWSDAHKNELADL